MRRKNSAECRSPRPYDASQPAANDISRAAGPTVDSNDGSDLDDFDVTGADEDAAWEVFIADDDERDPLPEAGDFWLDGND
jgi:hypothetical protein